MSEDKKKTSEYERTLRKRRLILLLLLLVVVVGILLLVTRLINTLQEDRTQKEQAKNLYALKGTSYTPKPTATITPTPTLSPTPFPIVMLDAGHGGGDDGAKNPNSSEMTEKAINLDIARRLRDKLEDAGYTVVMTRAADIRLSRERRVEIANESNADILVSIHMNTGPVGDTSSSGCEVYYNPENATVDRALAKAVTDALSEKTGARNRGVKEGSFEILIAEKVSCLVECGFISSDTEFELFCDEGYRDSVAEGILQGIISFFNGQNR